MAIGVVIAWTVGIALALIPLSKSLDQIFVQYVYFPFDLILNKKLITLDRRRSTAYDMMNFTSLSNGAVIGK